MMVPEPSSPPSCELAVVVPVFRNRETLAELAERVKTALGGASGPGRAAVDYRLLFVDDSSPDDSWSLVAELAQRDRRISGIRLARNSGQHEAIVAGLSRFDACSYVVLDADLQDPPELIPGLHERSRASDAVVFACRTGQYQSAGRMLTSRAFKALLRRMTGLPKGAGTYLALPRRVARAILEAPVSRRQVVVLAAAFGGRWEAVSYRRELRPEGRSAYSSFGRLGAGLRALRCSVELRSGRPGPPRPLSPIAEVTAPWA